MSKELTKTNTQLQAPDGDSRIALQRFTALLNKEPKTEELVSTADRKAFSMPISRVEMKLDQLFFGLWWTENFTTKQIYNEVVGEIELVVVHPVTGHQIRRVGAAAIQIMQDKDASIAQFAETKKKNALDLAYPKLKAECVKNAAQSLGKCFGRDINRKAETVDGYTPLIKPKKLPEDTVEKMLNKVRATPTQTEVIMLTEALVNLNVDPAQSKEIEARAQEIVDAVITNQEPKN